jgi:segregation and condensation protein B
MDEMEVNTPPGEADETAEPAADVAVEAAVAETEPETAAETAPPEAAMEEVFAEQLVIAEEPRAEDADRAQIRALIEAAVYITDEPLSLQQIAAALNHPIDKVHAILEELVAEYDKPEHGLAVREIAGGYKMATKPEHHEAIRTFVRNLKPPLRLSLAALETLAVVAYKQPVTAPEILEIRGVQGVGVLKTLLDRRLIAAAGRKNVVGKPILYRTTKEFLIQFGLSDLSELPTLKEFEELGKMALSDEPEAAASATDAETAASVEESAPTEAAASSEEPPPVEEPPPGEES